MKRFVLLLVCLFVGKVFSQEMLAPITVGKNIKMLSPTSIYRVDGVQSLGAFGNDYAPKIAFIGGGEKITLTVTEIYDTVGFYQPGFKKPKPIERNVVIEKSFFRSSIKAYAKNVKFYQDEIKQINKRDMIVFEFEAELESKTATDAKVTKKIYRYLQYCFVKKRKYIFNFQCPYDQKGYWQPAINQIMNSIKITK